MDSWGTATLVTIGWSIIYDQHSVRRPAQKRLHNALAAVLLELQFNYDTLARRKARYLPALSWSMFDAYGIEIMGTLDHDAALSLMGLYRHLQLLTSYKASRRLAGLTLDSQQHRMRILFNTAIRGIENADPSLHHHIARTQASFERAYKRSKHPLRERILARLLG